MPSDALLAALTGMVGPIDRPLLDGVQRLSKVFTVGRDDLGHDYWADPDLRRGYLQYFLPVTVGKVAALLQEMPPLPSRALNVLDVGSGPGAGVLAFLDYALQGTYVCAEVVAVDRSREVLHDAEFLWSQVAAAYPGRSAGAFHTVRLDLERPGSRAPWKDRAFDLIILSNSLNELFRSEADPIGRRAKLTEQLLSVLADDGTLMIIEPALRGVTREMHQVRDKILAGGHATVYSPCLHDTPCPALINPHDWCHEERSWSPPAVIREIDAQVGFIKDALKFSYLLLRKDGRTIVDRGPTVHRVVSELLEMKGDKRAWLCNESGRQLVGRLDKACSDTNRVFDDWRRGAIIRVDQIERRGPVGRIVKDSRVDLIRPT